MPSLPQNLCEVHQSRRPQFKGPSWDVQQIQSQDGGKIETRAKSRDFEAGQGIIGPKQTGPHKGH